MKKIDHSKSSNWVEFWKHEICFYADWLHCTPNSYFWELSFNTTYAQLAFSNTSKAALSDNMKTQFLPAKTVFVLSYYPIIRRWNKMTKWNKSIFGNNFCCQVNVSIVFLSISNLKWLKCKLSFLFITLDEINKRNDNKIFIIHVFIKCYIFKTWKAASLYLYF